MFHPSTYTVESVTSGHPDKVCDQISDRILDAYLIEDPMSRVAIESFGSHGLLVIGGEVTSRAQHVDIERLAWETYRDIGYSEDPEIIVHVATQSPDIAQGVDTGGAGDQGIMYGYATNETPEFLPRAVVLAHALARGLERLRQSGDVSWLGPDGKTQVSMNNGHISSILVSTQHDPTISLDEIRETLIAKLIAPLVGDLSGIEILVNPTGLFTIGGFAADAGLTGRKIMVDTYGGLIPHGGGAFSGKDATKVDRSAAYMCRFVAKNLVAHGVATSCLVSVAYAIGRAEPVMVYAADENGDAISPDLLAPFDFRPQAIIERLGLRRPIFAQTSAYGHFGKAGLPWEEVG
jgi:S-adenosylmethionine synthetase